MVELIIVIVLLGILAVVGSNMLSDSFKVTRMINAGNASESEARYALERLVREIREVKKIDSGYCLTTWTSSRLVFAKRNAASTDSASCATESTSIDFSYSGSSLTLNGAVLTNWVDTNGFALAYYRFDPAQTDGSVIAATTVATVQLIEITLTVKDSTSGQAIAQRVRVALRNSL